jgi:hypothetical protein
MFRRAFVRRKPGYASPDNGMGNATHAALRAITSQQRRNFRCSPASSGFRRSGFRRRTAMGFGRGAVLWLLGVPLPIILLLALFWHH